MVECLQAVDIFADFWGQGMLLVDVVVELVLRYVCEYEDEGVLGWSAYELIAFDLFFEWAYFIHGATLNLYDNSVSSINILSNAYIYFYKKRDKLEVN